MTIGMFAAAAALSLLGLYIHYRTRTLRMRKTLRDAQASGLAISKDGNIDAEITFASMLQEEERKGRRFEGKQARFMELVRLVSEGPKTIAEIRFLFEEGMEPVIRPDGVVYVPAIENEHMYMEGELDLLEEDLDSYVAAGFIKEQKAA